MLQQDDQSACWKHIVVTITVNKVTRLGRLDMYFNGKKVDQTKFDGMYVSGIVIEHICVNFIIVNKISIEMKWLL